MGFPQQILSVTEPDRLIREGLEQRKLLEAMQVERGCRVPVATRFEMVEDGGDEAESTDGHRVYPVIEA